MQMAATEANATSVFSAYIQKKQFSATRNEVDHAHVLIQVDLPGV